MTTLRSVCVLCGARTGVDPDHRAAAKALGRALAEHGIRLIYGGGSVGLMGLTADAVLDHGGTVIGIIPEFLIREEVGHRELSELIVTDSMHDRKRRMFALADGFVVLPGGIGTLDETFEILSWKTLRLHDSPIVVLDVNDYWGPLVRLIDATIAGEFASPTVAKMLTVVNSAEDAITALALAPERHAGVDTAHL